jgi:hypothetical protein
LIGCGLQQNDFWNRNPIKEALGICKTIFIPDWKHLHKVLGWICGVTACWYLDTGSGEQSCTWLHLQATKPLNFNKEMWENGKSGVNFSRGKGKSTLTWTRSTGVWYVCGMCGVWCVACVWCCSVVVCGVRCCAVVWCGVVVLQCYSVVVLSCCVVLTVVLWCWLRCCRVAVLWCRLRCCGVVVLWWHSVDVLNVVVCGVDCGVVVLTVLLCVVVL